MVVGNDIRNRPFSVGLQVRDDCRYVWGEGLGTSLEEADRQALASLVSKVSVTVTSDYRCVEQQVRSTGGNDDYVLLLNHQSACSSLSCPTRKEPSFIADARTMSADGFSGRIWSPSSPTVATASWNTNDAPQQRSRKTGCGGPRTHPGHVRLRQTSPRQGRNHLQGTL